MALPEQTINWEKFWRKRDSTPGRGTKFFFSQNRLYRLWDPTRHLFNSTGVYFPGIKRMGGRSQRPRGLRPRSAAACLLRSWVRIPPGAWMFVCCECCVLSGRGLCDELITCPEESYRMWCVIVCDLETSWMRGAWPTGSCGATNKQTKRLGVKLTANLYLL